MLTVGELLIATKGQLINGKSDSSVVSFSTDTRSIKNGDAFIAIKGDNFDGHEFIAEAIVRGASCIIRRSGYQGAGIPGNSIAVIEVEDTIKALGDIAKFKRNKFNIPIIAISGSNGKTTTKEMIFWVLSDKFKVLKNEGTKNNHIGVPFALLNLDLSHQIGVLEFGTNHFGEIGYLANICQPNVGVITNIGPSHLEYFGNLIGVFKEKYSLIENLVLPGIGLLNADDELLNEIVLQENNNKLNFSFGVNKKSDFSVTNIKVKYGHLSFLVNRRHRFKLKTSGKHNIYNALASIAVARIFGMKFKDIIRKLAAFDFPPGRFKILELNKAIFIDDTYNSNPLSFNAALKALKDFKGKGRRIVVMGDMLELGPNKELFHHQAGREAAQVCDTFITVGELSKFAAESARSSGINNIFSCASSKEARDILFNKVLPGKHDVVLVKGSRSMKMEGVFK